MYHLRRYSLKISLYAKADLDSASEQYQNIPSINSLSPEVTGIDKPFGKNMEIIMVFISINKVHPELRIIFKVPAH